MSPQQAREAIGRGVKRGLERRAELKPYVLAPPYTMTLKVRQERPPYKGAERVGAGESRFTSPNLLDVLHAFNAMK
jgi:D-aminopeptidase